MTVKAKRAQYTLEFKLEAVRLVKNGQSLAAASATLGVVQQTLHNWVKAAREGKLVGAGAKPVSPEQMELARLRAEVSRLKMALDITKKAAARSTGRCNTFWSNVGPGGKVGESKTKMRAIACTKDVGKYIATTNSNHNLPVAPNLLERNFTATAPNQVWTSDITYCATAEGWVYLAVIIDLFNRQVVGWSMQPHMKAELVTDALRMAWFRRRPEAGVIVHSDKG